MKQFIDGLIQKEIERLTERQGDYAQHSIAWEVYEDMINAIMAVDAKE